VNSFREKMIMSSAIVVAVEGGGRESRTSRINLNVSAEAIEREK
jgi:hypothetical protein